MTSHSLIRLTVGLFVTGIMLAGCSSQTTQAPEASPTPVAQLSLNLSPTPAPSPTLSPKASPKNTKEGKVPMSTVIVKTSKGDIEIQLLPNKAPKTVQNFLSKATSGYYVNLTFHRVEDWVVQGGDPLGNGTGGGNMPTELSDQPFGIGSVGVARAGDINVSNDSQFFICKTDCSFLNGQYTNFGTVTKGMDVVTKIEIGDKILGIQALQ